MRIIYVSNCCTNQVLERLRKEYAEITHSPAQKFHKLLLEGLSSDISQDVHELTFFQIKNTEGNKKILHFDSEEQDRVHYHYLTAAPQGIRTSLRDFKECKNTVQKLADKEKAVVICDALRTTTSAAVLSACRKMKIPCYANLTDMPAVRSDPRGIKERLAGVISQHLLNRYDGYIFLTEQMNHLVNKQNKPYITIGCPVDVKMEKVKNLLENKSRPRSCVFAGGLWSVYGIPQMVRGFLKADMPDVELHIYGSGECAAEIRELAEKHRNLKYYGVQPNEIVVEDELRASLLINPRPVGGEYSEYSFPSKNVEYMVSGTPMLGLKLAGIPDKYFSHMFITEDSTEEGFAKAFREIFSMDAAMLHRKGMEAKEFVLRENNNIKIGKEILSLLSRDKTE